MNKFFTKFHNSKKGFTLVETIVAISIFTASLLAFMAVLSSGIASTTYAKQKITAGYLAQEGIEYARNLRDTNVLYNSGGPQAGWNTFKNNTTINYPITNPTFSLFSRSITVDVASFGPDDVKVTSTVSWQQGSGPRSVVLSEHLFNWVE